MKCILFLQCRQKQHLCTFTSNQTNYGYLLLILLIMIFYYYYYYYYYYYIFFGDFNGDISDNTMLIFCESFNVRNLLKQPT